MFYSGLFLISGAALLAITYLLVRFTFPAAALHSYSARNPARTGPPLGHLPSLAALQAQDRQQRRADLDHLLVVSGIALVGMALASVALGWLVAGRVLRPLRTITAAARDISSTSLDRRLALSGPQDELKELADTFDGLLSRLEASFQSQRQFVANASHELRTPVTLERALLEDVLTQPDASAGSLRATCERLLAGNTRQGRLIEALLTLATSDRGIDRWEHLDLAGMAGQALASRQAEAGRLGLRVDAALGPAPGSGDPDLAERLIANLTDNAIRYNIAGGWVEVSTGTDAGEATVRVRNTGPAVPAPEVSQLFEPFRRLGHERTRHRDGHGLGLSIVAAIARAHQATVRAQVRTGGGLDVEVRFPLARAESTRADSAEAVVVGVADGGGPVG